VKRTRLSRIPEVIIDGNRVIFPEWLLRSIEKIVDPNSRKKPLKPIQTELFDKGRESSISTESNAEIKE
jgi:hypothetical protein